MLPKLCAAFIHLYLLLVYYTSRWQRKGYQHVLQNAAAGKPQIFVFWHGRVTAMPYLKPKTQKVFVVASRHRDGQLLSYVMEAFGLNMIRGSSRRAGSNKDRGGRSVLKAALNKLREGKAVAITPDGPRGPRMRVSGHVITIAKMTGAEIIPMSYSSTCGHLFESWDRFFLPLPFGRIYFMAGEPITIPAAANAQTVEKLRRKLEDTLNTLTHAADKAANRTISPEPAPLV